MFKKIIMSLALLSVLTSKTALGMEKAARIMAFGAFGVAAANMARLNARDSYRDSQEAIKKQAKIEFVKKEAVKIRQDLDALKQDLEKKRQLFAAPPSKGTFSRWIANHDETILALFVGGAGAGLGILGERNAWVRSALGGYTGGTFALNAIVLNAALSYESKISATMTILGGMGIGALIADGFNQSGRKKSLKFLMGIGGALVGLKAATSVLDRAEEKVEEENGACKNVF